VAFLGVFALPLVGIENPELQRLSSGLSIVLFVGGSFFPVSLKKMRTRLGAWMHPNSFGCGVDGARPNTSS